jgi:coproporphyrinogen III oxidase
MRKSLNMDGDKWFACGLSLDYILSIHMCQQFMPTGVILNCTMKKDYVIDRWFGGGTDLTPYYLFEEDAKHFHQT